MNKSVPRAFPLSYPPREELLPKGTVFYVDMEPLAGNAKINPDLSGNNNNVIWSGVTSVSKLYGKAAHFNGSTAGGTIVNTPSVGLDILKPPLSSFAWVYPTTANQGGYIFGKCNSAGNTLQYTLGIDTYNYRLQTYLNGYSGVSANNTISLNKWQMVGFVWDGSNLQFYINGVPSGGLHAYSSASLTTQTGIYVNGPSGSRFVGNIGEIWVMKNKILPADVKSLFLETAWKYGVEL